MRVLYYIALNCGRAIAVGFGINRGVMNVLPGIIFAGILYLYMSRYGSSMSGGGSSSSSGSNRGGMGGIFQFGKSTARKIKKEDIKVTFNDFVLRAVAKSRSMKKSKIARSLPRNRSKPSPTRLERNRSQPGVRPHSPSRQCFVHGN